MNTPTKTLLVHQPVYSAQIRTAEEAARYYGREFEPISLEEFLTDPLRHLGERRHVVALLDSADLSLLLKQAHQHDFSVGILPVSKNSIVCRSFKIPASIEDAVPLALSIDAGQKLDLLLCNDEAVLWMVTAGEIPIVDLRQKAYERQSALGKLRDFFASIPNITKLQPFDLSITSDKGSQIKTAVTGILVVENDVESLAAALVNETISSKDNRLSAIFVSPASIMDYLGFLLDSYQYRIRTLNRLPRAVSYIKTEQLTLQSSREVTYSIDGRQRKASKLTLRSVPNGVKINVGEKYKIAHKTPKESKDTFKTRALPQNEARLARLKKSMPLFSAAVEEDFKDLFLLLRDSAQVSGPYVVLMILSAMLATFGMFLNSAPVVIGAMVLAPLMAPIVSISMGILRNDRKLYRNALWVFFVGVGSALAVASLTTLLIPYEQITGEIRARLQPSLLDLGVAIVSGVAAAYAHAKENILKSLPGVAIAVALVPPLCVVGIGLAWLDWRVISGAGLLFLTNFAGIALAGALTFQVLGFSTVLRVTRGLGFSVALLALVSLPLYHSFANTITQSRIARAVSAKVYKVNGKTIELDDVAVVSSGDKIHVSAQLSSGEAIVSEDVAALRDFISEQLEQPVRLDVAIRIVR